VGGGDRDTEGGRINCERKKIAPRKMSPARLKRQLVESTRSCKGCYPGNGEEK